MAVDMYKNK